MVPVAVGRMLKERLTSGALSPDLGPEELAHAIDEVQAACANARTEKLINMRDYTEAQLATKLSQDGYSPSAVRTAVARAVRIGLVDNLRYGDVLIRSKMAAGWGQVRIAQKLKQVGISPESIPGWPDAYFERDSEAERAYALLAHKRLTGKNDYPKLVRHLANKGFSLSVCVDAAKRRLAAAEEDC